MEVTTIETIPLRYPLDDGAGYGSARGLTSERNALLVRIETRDGTVGWGESFGPTRTSGTFIEEVLVDRVVGMDPFDAGSLSDWLYATGYHYASSGIAQSGLSGVDMALWDLKGKAAGTPIAKLLDGPTRETVTPYASTMYYTEDERDPEPELREAMDDGFTAVKIKIGRSIDEDEERVRLAREVLGDDQLLMVDVNGNYRTDQAIRAAKAIEPYDIGWLEEPVPPEDIAGYREVRESTSIPIAGGEAVSGRFGFERLFDERAVDLLQPDLCLCGGLSEGQLIARMASTENIAVTPHCWMSGVGLTASLHFAAAVPSYPHGPNVPEPLVFEVDRSHNPLRRELLTEPLDPTGGSLAVPDGDGLGVTVDEDAVERYRVDG